MAQLIQSFNVMALPNQLFHMNIYNNPYLANQLLLLARCEDSLGELLKNKRTSSKKAAALPLDRLRDIFFINDYQFI